MMDSTTYDGMSEEFKKVFSDQFERTTLPADSLREEIQKKLGLTPADQIEFFRQRQEKFREIKK